LLSVTDGNVLGSARAPIAQPISSVCRTSWMYLLIRYC